jgi:eukaryotic-like serine/threonine-protein kinase
LHARLAEVLAGEPNVNPQRLVRHYRAAGDKSAAYRSALAAGLQAEGVFAFDRAAELYKEALDCTQVDPRNEEVLRRSLASVLAKAGRGYDSAQIYLEAARLQPFDAFDLRRLATEQLLRSGYIDEGIDSFRSLLGSLGVWIPATPLQSLLAMITVRAIISIRGLRWQEQKEGEVPVRVLRRLDLLWTGALVMTGVNPILATYLQARHLLCALRVGEPLRLSNSIGLGALYTSLSGTPDYDRGRKLLAISRNIAESLQSPYLTAMNYGYLAMLDHFCGRIVEGLDHCQTAIALMREKCTGVSWEMATVQMTYAWFLGWGGRLRQLTDIISPLLDEARCRGDIYAEVSIRCYTTAHLVHLAADQPDRALKEAEYAVARWRRGEYNLQHFGAMFARAESELYAGRVEEARRLILDDWKPLRGSLLFRKCRIFRVMLFYLRARTALAAWLAHSEDIKLRREVKTYIWRLAHIGSPWANPISNALRAGVYAKTGRLAEAIRLLEEAESNLRHYDLRLLAAAVRRRRGELEGDKGETLIHAADQFMSSEGVVRPDRMAAVVLPGYWL